MRVAIFLLLVGRISLFGSDIRYPVHEIPAELKENMYAVIREKNVRHTIKSRNSYLTHYREVITILNPGGRDYATIKIHYDKMTTIKSIRAIVYNALGQEVKKLKQNEIEDSSTFDGFSLFNDNRIKTVTLTQPTYPFTIEYEYEVVNNFLYSFPTYFLYVDDEVSVERQTYSIVYPANNKPRYRVFKATDPTIVPLGSGQEELKWEFINTIPAKFEYASPYLNEIVPSVWVAPNDFEYGGFEGNMSTWQNFGLWQLKLNEGRDILPEATRQKIRELTRNAKSVEERARIVYSFLQNKTRYVSIQEGLGGLQPFPATLVDEVGYGDCKALSNYTVALLREVGVNGYYAKIRAGENEPPMVLDFPSHQTNHIIVVVPNAKDTIWLECTSQTNPFGYLGSFTGDRHALMVTEHGGTIIKTQTYSGNQNQQIRSGVVVLDKTGNAKASVKTRFTGLQFENDNLNFIVDAGQDEQKKWVQATTKIPNFDIQTFSIFATRNKIPEATVSCTYDLNRYAQVSGKRIFLTPNLMNRSTFVPPTVEQRRTPVVRRLAYIDVDSIHFKIPADLYLEFIPEPIKIETPYGIYESIIKFDQDGLLYVRRVEMRKGVFPASTYTQFIDFYKSINKADNMKLVFLNKT